MLAGDKMMDEMVSVIVPTYNREKQIERALRSIFRQTYKNYEIIVIDDGSTDQTQEIVSRMKDARIQYIRSEHNQGAAHARNVGIQASKYDYIAFLDSDDEWHPDKLEKQMRKILTASREVGMIYCRMHGAQEGGHEQYYMPPYECLSESLKGDMFRFLLWRNLIGTPTMLIRRECLESTGRFKESLPCLEDYELVLRIAEEWKIDFIDDVLVEVHRTPNSLTSKIIEQLVVQCYLVSKYRQQMAVFGILGLVQEEILRLADLHNIREEIGELLNRDFEL